MGIRVFYIVALCYALISGLGIIHNSLGTPYTYILISIVFLYGLYYIIKARVELYHTIILGILINLSSQLTGGFNSPLFLAYFIVIPIIGFRSESRNYWIIVSVLVGIEVLAGIFRHEILFLPATVLVLSIFVFGLFIERILARVDQLKHSLTKYETRDQFFGPADFEAMRIITSIKDIDRHKGIERPLLYFVKFIHNMFDAYTTAVFSYNEGHLILIQGFSRSELFRPDTVIDLKSGIYRQVIAQEKSFLIKEFSQDPVELGYYKGELKISSVMIAPIILVNKVEGILVVDKKEGQFTEDDKARFDEASNTFGYFLGMLRLYEKERFQARHLLSIAELGERFQKELELNEILGDTIKTVKDFLKCDDVSIAVTDELNNEGRVLASTYFRKETKFPLDEGLVGFIARHRSPILKEDLYEGNPIILKKGMKTKSGSFVGSPVLGDEQLLGVIWCEDHKRKKFTEDDVKALVILSSQLSLAWERAHYYEMEKERALRDGLTGLYNHRHFQESLAQEIKKGREVYLLFIDVDHFKLINDTYGHRAGDEVLKFLGKLISHTGIACRYGGEEFTIILPGYSLKKAMKTAVHIKDSLLKSMVKFNEKKIKFTVSMGIAGYPVDATTRDELIERADQALYYAKETGRDRIVVARSLTTKK